MDVLSPILLAIFAVASSTSITVLAPESFALLCLNMLWDITVSSQWYDPTAAVYFASLLVKFEFRIFTLEPLLLSMAPVEYALLRVNDESEITVSFPSL